MTFMRFTSIWGNPAKTARRSCKKRGIAARPAPESSTRQEELCRDFAFPVLQWQAKYESIYLLGTSIARPLISKVCLQVAREMGSDAYAHGATGKGNDQCRFQLAAEALDPHVQVIAPWRIQRFRQQFPGRTEMIAYCEQKQIPVKVSQDKPYSSDENCLHISYEAGRLEDLTVNGVELVDFGMSVSPQQAPDVIEVVTIGFKSGVPTTLDGHSLGAHEMVMRLNEIGGRNGIGRIDMVENRFVGMKSRGVYEAPGMTVLYQAHLMLEQLTLDRDLVHLRDRLSPEVAEMVYYGYWYAPKFDALLAFIPRGATAGYRRGHIESLQGQHGGRAPQQSPQPVRRSDRDDGRRRLVRPNRCRRLPPHSRTAGPSAGSDSPPQLLSQFLPRRRSAIA